MLGLALQTLRGRRQGLAGAFVALTLAVMLMTACGVLIQSGLQARPAPERYAAAPLVVAADDRMRTPINDGERVALPEPRRLPAALGDRVAAVGGVRAVVADRSVPVAVTAGGGRPLAGPDGERLMAHGWSSAALTPFALVRGRPPVGDAEVVLDLRLAASAGADVGRDVRLVAADGVRTARVTGFARGTPAAPAAVFLSDERVARLVADRSTVDAFGVLLVAGARQDDVVRRVRDAVGDRAQVLTGGDRGRAEAPDEVARNDDLVALAAAFASTAAILAIFVVAATLGLSVSQRGREIALLRTIGATPRQVRRLVVREALVVALAAGLIGAAPGLLLGAGLFAALHESGLGAEHATLALGVLPPLAAVLAGLLCAGAGAWAAARRASRMRPTAALAEAAVELRRVGPVRVLLGVVLLAAGAFLCATAMSEDAATAADTTGGVVMTLIASIALLGPLVARAAAALAGPWMARRSPASGFLAQASLRSRAGRFASVSTPLAMTVAFAVATVGTTSIEARAGREQVQDRIVAARVLSGPAGISDELVGAIRRLPGVVAVTGLLPTEVAAVSHPFDGPQFAFVPAAALSGDGPGHTLDLDVRRGSFAALGPGTVALSEDWAHALRADVGSRVALWLGDGTPVRVRVVAVYASSLGFGDVVLPRAAVAAHVAVPTAAQALVAAGPAHAADVAQRLHALAAAYPGTRVADRGAAQAESADAGGWVDYLILGALIAFCVVAVVNTLVMATAERTRELALLRLVGATAAQVTRMLRWEALAIVGLGLLAGLTIAAATLVPFSLAVAGRAVPAVPVPFVLGVVALAAALGLAATELPARVALRQNPAMAINAR
jgi:putative ABC transport system permease protein